jgi:dTDP-4-amino-4,6-dideoxygalactose transaminase
MNTVYVTRPQLPPLVDIIPYLEKIWESRVLTNNGPFHEQLEAALCEYLGVKYLSLFTNGMLALITSLQALRITGEVITTPFSFVATTHALHWTGNKPVFVDVDPSTGNLDPALIEAAITPQTTAILPVHVYSNPCAVDEIRRIADTYGLKVIYDAAHTFGARLDDKSLVQFGDLSILSFHATKVFNTFEGGAIVSHDAEMKKRIDFLKNFGFADETSVVAPGMNGKMNEFQAAVGLLQLKYLDGALLARAQVAARYRAALSGMPGLSMFAQDPAMTSNHASFPVLIDDGFGITRDELYSKLRAASIYVRRYFYPLISNFPPYRGLPSARPDNLRVATRLASQVLCLPIYPDLAPADQDRVVQIIADR